MVCRIRWLVQQHSVMFVRSAIDKGVQVDYMIYPGHEHNVLGKRPGPSLPQSDGIPETKPVTNAPWLSRHLVSLRSHLSFCS